MKQIHPDEGMSHLLLSLAAASLVFRLFTSDTAMSPSRVNSDFTEATGGTGYAPVTYDESDFSIASLASHIGTIIAADITFAVSSGSQTIYGYYVTNLDNSVVVACGRFSDAPRTLDASNPIVIPAKLALQSRYIAA